MFIWFLVCRRVYNKDYITSILMSLEVITLKEGIRLAQRVVPERGFSFVRGWRDHSNHCVRLILEEHLLVRHRYHVIIDFDDIFKPNIIDDVLLVPYKGHLLFQSMEEEDNFYANLNQALQEDRIKPEEYEFLLRKINARLKVLYSRSSETLTLGRERRVNIALCAAGLAGILAVIASKSKKRNLLTFLSAAFGSYFGAYMTQNYMERRSVIEENRIKPNDQLLGDYIVNATTKKQAQSKY